MNRIKQTIIALAIGLSLANCGDDFLDTKCPILTPLLR